MRRWNWKNAALLLVACAVVGGCALTGKPPVAAVPDDIAVDGPVVLRVHATGDQIYVWQPTVNAWKLRAPSAVFEGGGITGKHYAGPTWEASDGSQVKGTKLAEHTAPEPGAVPWLLLQASAHGGKGILSGVTFIQRLNTSGGIAPAEPIAPQVSVECEARIRRITFFMEKERFDGRDRERLPPGVE